MRLTPGGSPNEKLNTGLIECKVWRVGASSAVQRLLLDARFK